MGWEDFDYHNDIEIDDSDFVGEWLNQSKLFGKYAEACIKALRERSLIHEDLKIARSKLVKKCKLENPKATGPEIEAYYRTHHRHIKLKQKLIQAEYEHGQLENAVSNFRMRKYSLEQIQVLWFAKYYSEPQAKRSTNEFVDEIVKQQVKGKIAKKMQKRTRTK